MTKNDAPNLFKRRRKQTENHSQQIPNIHEHTQTYTNIRTTGKHVLICRHYSTCHIRKVTLDPHIEEEFNNDLIDEADSARLPLKISANHVANHVAIHF